MIFRLAIDLVLDKREREREREREGGIKVIERREKRREIFLEGNTNFPTFVVVDQSIGFR